MQLWRNYPHLLPYSQDIYQWNILKAVMPDNMVRTNQARSVPRSQVRDQTRHSMEGQKSHKAQQRLSTISWLYQKKGSYRLNSKQGQSGIQEAQTCTQSENHIAHQDYFRVGKKSKEWIPRGICFCMVWRTKYGSQLLSEKNHYLIKMNENKWIICWILQQLPMVGKMYMLKGTMINSKHPRTMKGTSYPNDW